ncbi:hypothetical protein PAXRUDRAFT_156916 [Paxillus rubicundulus Ve08.2h10]|uniref:Uncharacterized protein n=1 Tax=Paxillus rubicundulus Ve08.2h10 TaxID=930991 RepID=A0A0D0CEG2_9AGAM|nr:hypothetical protein PAXRUDRAFT_156916 [Paxillus rubicundulus Ve08.2h10]
MVSVHSRHNTLKVATRRREAVATFEEIYKVEGPAALVDTDFGSDYVSYNEDELTDDSKIRHQRQNIGKGSRMTVGMHWRTLDYVAFLRILDSLHKRGVTAPPPPQMEAHAGPNTQVGDDTQAPPSKCRRTTKKETHKNVFDGHPSKMTDRFLDLQSSKGTVPFKPMVNPVWLEANPSKEVVDKLPWLQGLRSHANNGDLTSKDIEYLEELATWIAKEEF